MNLPPGKIVGLTSCNFLCGTLHRTSSSQHKDTINLHLAPRPSHTLFEGVPIALSYNSKCVATGILDSLSVPTNGHTQRNRNSSRTVWENTEKMNETLVEISFPGTGAFAHLFSVLAVSTTSPTPLCARVLENGKLMWRN